MVSRKLDKYEQEIENSFDEQISIKSENDIKNFQESARRHLKAKHPITIRVSSSDIEAIKIKASKIGLPYQSYINMIIHKDVNGR